MVIDGSTEVFYDSATLSKDDGLGYYSDRQEKFILLIR